MFYEMKGNYFNGKFNQSPTRGPNAADKFLSRECPSNTSQILWKAPVDYFHVPEVVKSSESGFQFWRKISIEDKIQFLKRYQEQLIIKKDAIAEAIALESGKPIWEALGEAQSVIGKVDVTINDSLPRIKHQLHQNIMPSTDGHLYFKPLGPALIIGPFNFPCHLANTQILANLISGNSIILKPSEKTAYSAQLMIECFHEAGFPNGVINLIHGDGELSRRLLIEKSIRAVFFTGSKEVGLDIMKNTYSDLGKLVALELGGKNPAIVHSDANLSLAMEEILKGAFLTTGQRCTSTSLVFMHESIIDNFVEEFHSLSKKLIVDHPINHDKTPFMGPLIDQKSMDTYLLYMGMAKREGIKEVMRGKKLEKSNPGYFVSPSIHLASEWDTNSHFLMNEIFGPNCTFVPYKNFDSAIEMANSTEYGLAACLFTEDRSLYEKCVQELDTGLLNFNRSTCGASPKLPFGGVKNSGNYHPAAVAAIDGCVYQMSSLELLDSTPSGLDKIVGLDLD